ncbi:DNA-binding response regulator in two-component regulatory system with NarX (or NarQ) [Sterolibacterium denitrificans]|uniref:DNA-binding response regulator in two-component regulatory system with NarX (Or NarQ) n=1 Tax=Sterolibacterium denitrificans TaxID=157592 RepID=A0A7Z7HPM1_9PROT|nr:response regulator transcription factor [Sterolibacterium denitrificans]SMB22303.1 DNA-binding response regulator in two-component regulatory system with NarX (or NarQ) [Sterolibacterium denitrificans]
MTQEKHVRILLIDDHTLFRSGIKALLQRQPGFEVVGEAGDALEGVKRAKILRPDVVLLDIHMPGIAGREAVSLVIDEAPDARVLMLTVSEDVDDLMQALRAGAHGYLLKNIETDFLVNAIRSAVDGESVMSPQMTSKLMKSVSEPQAAPSPAGADKERLSPREREILGFLTRGASNKEIARSLDLAESTVKIHVQNILKKLNLLSRVQAAVYAIEHGLVERDDG